MLGNRTSKLHVLLFGLGLLAVFVLGLLCADSHSSQHHIAPSTRKLTCGGRATGSEMGMQHGPGTKLPLALNSRRTSIPCLQHMLEPLTLQR